MGLLQTQNLLSEVSDDHRLLLVEQVRRWGDMNTNAVLDSKCKLFSVPYIDGLIAYKVEADSAVVFGDPLCAEEDEIALTEAFRTYCANHHLNLVYTIISQRFAQKASKKFGNVLIQFGYRLIFDPKENPFDKTGAHAGLVRRKVRRAIGEGVSIQEYTDGRLETENAMEKLGKEWLSTKKGPHIADLHLFADREGKRWFYATHNGNVVGILVLHRIEASGGWLMNNLIVGKNAPRGTSEYLVIHVLDALKHEECKRVVVGPVTSQQIEKISGLNPVTAFFVRAFFKTSKLFFRLDNQYAFWEKFGPVTEPSYLMFGKIGLSSVVGLMRAMNVKI